MAMDFLSRSYEYKKRSHSLEWLHSMLALPIFPGRLQPSIVGRSELNFRVRDGNGWTLALISTNCYCNCISTVTNLYPIVKSCRVARSSVLHSKTLPQGEFISPEDFLSSRVPEKALLFGDGDPYRIRTDVNGVRGRCLNHLTNGPCLASWGPHWMVLPSSGMVHLQGLEPWTP